MKKTTWMDAVSEEEFWSTCDEVKRKQRFQDVFSGTRNENCDWCKFVVRDSDYPGGSPTGLICGKKNINVTANAVCDKFCR